MWVGAIFGVVGTIVGGGLSIWTTLIAQRHQHRSARQQVIEQRIDAAADAAIEDFLFLKQHLQVGPLFQVERGEDWEKTLKDRLSKVKTTLLRLRHKGLRDRLKGVTGFLDETPLIEDWQWGGSPDLPAQLCDHALECLGAFARDDLMPSLDQAMTTAARVEYGWFEQMAQDEEERYGHRGTAWPNT